MYFLSIDSGFSAAHLLRDYEGNCAEIHGHNWKVQVTVKTDQLDPVGMGLDFKSIKEITWQVLKKFDHQNLNMVSPFDKINPTAENLSRYIFEQINGLLPNGIHMHKISLWETENYLVEYME